MFCSWRKSPLAPCSCAYVLRSPISEVLNHLCYLGQGTMVLRQKGLSLAKITPFGLAVAHEKSGWNILHDQVSGLETDTSQPQNIYLMTNACDRRPLLAMGEPGQAIDLSIRLDGYNWESPAVTALLRKFNAASLDCAQSRRLGAGAWLDDWGDPAQPVSDGIVVRSATEILRTCEWLEVEIKSANHRNVVRFSPSFIDSEGGVLRVADHACRHVVYANVQAPDFRMAGEPHGPVRIFLEPTAA